MGNHIVRINGTLGGALIDFQNARIQLKLGDETSTMELFDDPASAQAIRALFQRTDGGVAYGRPDERPGAGGSVRRQLGLQLGSDRGIFASLPAAGAAAGVWWQTVVNAK